MPAKATRRTLRAGRRRGMTVRETLRFPIALARRASGRRMRGGDASRGRRWPGRRGTASRESGFGERKAADRIAVCS
jgi:hypothetical protein